MVKKLLQRPGDFSVVALVRSSKVRTTQLCRQIAVVTAEACCLVSVAHSIMHVISMHAMVIALWAC